jgi:hypothetical protein
MRRGVAFRGIRNYELAMKDFESAMEMFPEEEGCQKLITVTQEDVEMSERIQRIMEDSNAL